MNELLLTRRRWKNEIANKTTDEIVSQLNYWKTELSKSCQMLLELRLQASHRKMNNYGSQKKAIKKSIARLHGLIGQLSYLKLLQEFAKKCSHIDGCCNNKQDVKSDDI